jgi:T4-like virus tail tube protein gp19
MLPVSIDDLKSTISKRDGVARSNRFSVYMNIPIISISLTNIVTNLLKGNNALAGTVNNPRDISVLCETTGMPGFDVNTFETAYGIKRRKMPQAFDQQDIQFTFMVTNDYFSRNFLDTWCNSVINKLDGTINYKSDYASDIVIQQLDVKNFPIGGVKLYNAYPISVQEIPLSNNNDNDVTKITATFTYDYALNTDAIASSLDAGSVLLKSLGNFKIGF